jgi:hypothetical protein
MYVHQNYKLTKQHTYDIHSKLIISNFGEASRAVEFLTHLFPQANFLLSSIPRLLVDGLSQDVALPLGGPPFGLNGVPLPREPGLPPWKLSGRGR